MKQYIEFITRIARRYTLPTQCAITHDDLIQEAFLALLEHSAADGNLSLAHSVAEGERVPTGGKGASIYAIARRAMQRAITRYVSPVSHTIEETLPAPNEPDLSERQARDALLDTAITFIDGLDTQLAAGTITPANYRKKKQRFLHKLRRQVSQDPSFSVFI